MDRRQRDDGRSMGGRAESAVVVRESVLVLVDRDQENGSHHV